MSKFLAGGIKMNILALLCAGAVAGFFLPLLSHLPHFQSLNIVPFGWMWISGALAVALYRWMLEADTPMTGTDGVIAGIFTGVVASFTSLILAIILGSDGSTEAAMRMIAPVIEGMEHVLNLAHLQRDSFMLLFAFYLACYPILSGFGGLIGVALCGTREARGRL
jgi:hypothetical protein